MWPFSQHPIPELRPQDVGTPTPIDPHLVEEGHTYDYIIVGGGTAGCVLASRLSEDHGVTVLLIERGGVMDNWASKVPVISADLFRKHTPAARWFALPMPSVDERCLEVVRGECLGGASRVNAMVYTRGAPGDWNSWEALGNQGWGYDDLIPYFVKSESSLSQPASSFRGNRGPWQNQTFTKPPYQVLSHLGPATKAVGIPAVSDINSPKAPTVGFATLDVCIDKASYRCSTDRAFLPPKLAQDRKDRLKICTNTLVTRVEFSTDNGIRATGVHFEAVDFKEAGQRYFARARREIVLCAGALGSPQVLQLSGVGPRDHLQAKRIPVVLDLPGVGRNLQDHIGVPVMYQTPLDDSLHGLESSPLKAIQELLKYLVTGAGLFAAPFMQTSIFVPSRLLNERSEIAAATDARDLDSAVPANLPDIEIMPIAHSCSDVAVAGKGVFSLLVALVRPQSSGSVLVASSNPRARPDVDLGFMTHPHDYEVMRKGVRLALRLGEEIRRRGYPLQNMQVPETEDDADIDKFVRTHLRTSYHYASTCRMGPGSDDARPGVVDAELKVHGIRGLRVCDTSVFPEMIATHTMAPAVVVAEKCADMMKAARTRG
ncbi:alcohol oxidase [Amylostereum chailletii]|nr:alcohol oxidase [Amylostereum chailletii]